MNEDVIWITKNGVHVPITNAYMNDKIKQEANKQKYNDENFKYLLEDEEYDKYVEMSEESYSKLTPNEEKLISSLYTKTEHSYQVNDALRIGKEETDWLVKENFKELIDTMDKACKTYTSEQNMASTRFVDFDYLRNAYGLKIQKYGDIDRSQVANQMKQFIGSEISSKAYTSVSLNESGNGMFNNLAVKMKINMPKGTKMYVADNVGEFEAILGRNTKMQLKKVSFKQSTIKGFENEYGKVLLTYEVINDE